MGEVKYSGYFMNIMGKVFACVVDIEENTECFLSQECGLWNYLIPKVSGSW